MLITHNLYLFFQCATIGAPYVVVEEMNAAYKYIRQSHIADEVLLFDDNDSCMKYPEAFDKNVEVWCRFGKDLI